MEKYKQLEHINIFDDLPINILLINGAYQKKRVIEFFDNLGISNLSQLFEAYDNGVFNDGRKKHNKLIKASIELLRFKYLREDIIADVFLFEKIKTEKVGLYDIMSSESRNKLMRLLGSDCSYLLESYFNTGGSYKDVYYGQENKKRKNMENISIFGLLRAFRDDTEFRNDILESHLEGKWKSEKNFECDSEDIHDILQRIVLIEEYRASKLDRPTEEIEAAITHRQKELKRLQNQRRILDKQIEMIEANISSLQEERGMKK